MPCHTRAGSLIFTLYGVFTCLYLSYISLCCTVLYHLITWLCHCPSVRPSWYPGFPVRAGSQTHFYGDQWCECKWARWQPLLHIPLSSIILMNSWSLWNKTSELQAYVNYQGDFGDACILALTETWLREKDWDSTMSADVFVVLLRTGRYALTLLWESLTTAPKTIYSGTFISMYLLQLIEQHARLLLWLNNRRFWICLLSDAEPRRSQLRAPYGY